MKKLLVAALTLVCVATLTVKADDSTKDSAKDKKAARKELIEKYDTNKDGKLDKEEKGKMTKEDKEKWDKLMTHKKKAAADTSK